MFEKKLDKVLSKMTFNYNKNYKILMDVFNKYGKEYSRRDFLLILTSKKRKEGSCFLAIKSLLRNGINPNILGFDGCNFIQNALKTGYGETFIVGIIDESVIYSFDVNSVDCEGNSILHSAIYSENYKGKLFEIYDRLCRYGFDSTIKNKCGDNLLSLLMDCRGKFDQKDFVRVGKKIEQEMKKKREEKSVNDNDVFVPIKKNNSLDKSDQKDKNYLEELKSFGRVLNLENYPCEPAISREKELGNLIVSLAQNKKNPIIVGESGVGKTVIVDQLVYKIQKGDVPLFLKDKIILEINPGELVAGCKYVGQFEEKMKNLIKMHEKYGFIMFIDEIHTIYGVGSSEGKSMDMASIIKHCVDRDGLKVIGTTTEDEYQEFFASDALKRRFEKIVVKEPENEVLYKIINKVLDDYSEKSHLYFENNGIKEKVITAIIKCTEKSHRVYNDRVNNPDLAISIIDKAYAFSKVNEDEYINVKNFIDSFSCCDRIYDSTKKKVVSMLKSNMIKKEHTGARILNIDLTKYSR